MCTTSVKLRTRDATRRQSRAKQQQQQQLTHSQPAGRHATPRAHRATAAAAVLLAPRQGGLFGNTALNKIYDRNGRCVGSYLSSDADGQSFIGGGHCCVVPLRVADYTIAVSILTAHCGCNANDTRYDWIRK
jgi:hypothetical protein